VDGRKQSFKSDKKDSSPGKQKRYISSCIVVADVLFKPQLPACGIVGRHH
jgi:hypothetical protein